MTDLFIKSIKNRYVPFDEAVGILLFTKFIHPPPKFLSIRKIIKELSCNSRIDDETIDYIISDDFCSNNCTREIILNFLENKNCSNKTITRLQVMLILLL